MSLPNKTEKLYKKIKENSGLAAQVKRVSKNRVYMKKDVEVLVDLSGKFTTYDITKGWFEGYDGPRERYLVRRAISLSEAIKVLNSFYETEKENAMKTKKTASKKSNDSKKKAASKPRRGVGVNAKWIELFEDVALGREGKDWTDSEITEIMKATFPDRQSKVFEQVSLVRGRYNRGALPGQDGKAPKKKAYRVYEDEVGTDDSMKRGKKDK